MQLEEQQVKVHRFTTMTRVWLQSYLCRNTCMVTSRNPQHSVALHSSPGGNSSDTFVHRLSFKAVKTQKVQHVTIEPERLPLRRSERGPRAEFQSH